MNCPDAKRASCNMNGSGMDKLIAIMAPPSRSLALSLSRFLALSLSLSCSGAPLYSDFTSNFTEICSPGWLGQLQASFY